MARTFHLGLDKSKEPPRGTFRHSLWVIRVQEPAMRALFAKEGRPIDSVSTMGKQYHKRVELAWTEYFDNYPVHARLGAYGPDDCPLWYALEEALDNALKSKSTSDKITQIELAWTKYLELKEKQIAEKGKAHPQLRPPGFDTRVASSWHRRATEGTQTNAPEPAPQEGKRNRYIQTSLSYDNSKELTKPQFSLRDDQKSSTLPAPFHKYTPEEFVMDLFETDGRVRDYCSQACHMAGRPPPNIRERVQLVDQATGLLQKALDTMATARQMRDLSVYIDGSNYGQAKELLGELHTRLCKDMTTRRSLARGLKAEARATEKCQKQMTGAMSIEFLEAIESETEQKQPSEGIAKARLDITRVQFCQLENFLKTSKFPKTAVKRSPVRKEKHYAFYTIWNEQIARQFFEQANLPNIMQISKNDKVYEANISKDAPMKIRFGQLKKKECKLVVSVYYRIL